jgi:hypothetical protein
MPSRIVREGINGSSRINALSPLAELFYRRLMTVADDFGRYYSSPVNLRAACWPRCPERVTEKQVQQWLNECLAGDNPLIICYESDGCGYLEITNFGQQTRGKSKFPAPEQPKPFIQNCLSVDNQELIGCEADAQPSRSRIPYFEGVLRIPESNKTLLFSEPENVSDETRLKEMGWLGPKKTPDEVCIAIARAKFEPNRNSKSPDGISETLAGFECFWGIYFRHEAKADARVAFFERVKNDDALLDVLCKAAEMQGRWMLERPKEKRPLAATWIRGERWLDKASSDE